MTPITLVVPAARGAVELVEHAYERLSRDSAAPLPPLEYKRAGSFLKIKVECPSTMSAYDVLLWTLVAVNLWCLNTGDYPSLFESGVVFAEEPQGQEEWLSIPALYEQGSGDCEDLSCAFIAERLNSGRSAEPEKLWRRKPQGGKAVHIVAKTPEGIVDVSSLLGMR